MASRLTTRLARPSSLLACRGFSTTPSLPKPAAEALAPAPSSAPTSQSQQSTQKSNLSALTSRLAGSSLPPRPAPLTKNPFLDRTPKTSSTTPFSSNIESLLKDDIAASTVSGSNSLTNWAIDDFTSKNYARQQTLRLRPSTGRTVDVNKWTDDPARALNILNMMCQRNGLRRDVQLQRFHERPALKRKRQWRERWRVRFKLGFKATIDRVNELRKQGW
ncbi:hypothetical protein QBC35DRAFT_143496 [Podospora australis]|uniref:Uncharacterized protein n=1 Tax=Podospora australis TaxID=1536484 RepID=A0AAN6WMA2_9PEZI|nr:hypothetical protein QBC35DRAFT_143496 [Podospora australis]